jgi:CRP-like cAMP-binding protein
MAGDETEDTTRIRIRIPARRKPTDFDELIDEIPLFDDLPRSVHDEIINRCLSRTFDRGVQLRGMLSNTSMVHIILRGCVAERSISGHVRFRGKGAILGDTEVFDEVSLPANAETLARTWTLSYPMERMRILANSDPTLMKNLGLAVSRRLKTEMVYASSRKSVASRFAGLLLELVDISGGYTARPASEKDRPPVVGGIFIGPTQADMADALMVSSASVDAVVAALRQMCVLDTGHRRITIEDLDVLKDIARGLTVVKPFPKRAPK